MVVMLTEERKWDVFRWPRLTLREGQKVAVHTSKKGAGMSAVLIAAAEERQACQASATVNHACCARAPYSPLVDLPTHMQADRWILSRDHIVSSSSTPQCHPTQLCSALETMRGVCRSH